MSNKIKPKTGKVCKSPRVYINPNRSGDRSFIEDLEYTYLNTEITVYRKRLEGNPRRNGSGLVIGCRSGANGHALSNDKCNRRKNFINARTYYAKFRNDYDTHTGLGKIGLAKERVHGAVSSTEKIFTHEKFTGNPLKKWIGMKFICYNIPNHNKVRLEIWMDNISNANPKLMKKSNWIRLVTFEDGYNIWEAKNANPPFDIDVKEPLMKGGIIIIRDDDLYDKSKYKYIEVREIQPTIPYD
jgi:hypothetical protein